MRCVVRVRIWRRRRRVDDGDWFDTAGIADGESSWGSAARGGHKRT